MSLTSLLIAYRWTRTACSAEAINTSVESPVGGSASYGRVRKPTRRRARSTDGRHVAGVFLRAPATAGVALAEVLLRTQIKPRTPFMGDARLNRTAPATPALRSRP